MMQTRFANTDQAPKPENSIHPGISSKMGFMLGAALLGTLTGCIGYVDEPRYGRAYAPPPPVYVESGVVVQDDYVYYPDYQVYYSSSRRHYVYMDGSAWVTRAAPPHVSVGVLVASPSVRLAFHDAPAMHHASVVQQYPKHWRPNHGQGNGHDGQGNGQEATGKRSTEYQH
jgi:hypothetical protein